MQGEGWFRWGPRRGLWPGPESRVRSGVSLEGPGKNEDRRGPRPGFWAKVGGFLQGQPSGSRSWFKVNDGPNVRHSTMVERTRLDVRLYLNYLPCYLLQEKLEREI